MAGHRSGSFSAAGVWAEARQGSNQGKNLYEALKLIAVGGQPLPASHVGEVCCCHCPCLRSWSRPGCWKGACLLTDPLTILWRANVARARSVYCPCWRQVAGLGLGGLVLHRISPNQ